MRLCTWNCLSAENSRYIKSRVNSFVRQNKINGLSWFINQQHTKRFKNTLALLISHAFLVGKMWVVLHYFSMIICLFTLQTCFIKNWLQSLNFKGKKGYMMNIKSERNIDPESDSRLGCNLSLISAMSGGPLMSESGCRYQGAHHFYQSNGPCLSNRL